MIKKGRQIDATSSVTPPAEWWVVPPHLKGLSCVLCGVPFQDGDTHGLVQDDGMTLVCLTQKVSTP